jgi:cyanate lyase
VGLSKEWVTAACLGQMTLNSEQAALVGAIFDLALGEKCDVVPSARVIPAARPAFVSM